MENGADIDYIAVSYRGSALAHCGIADIPKALDISKMLINAGAVMTDKTVAGTV